jgi:Domain of unknown function (DUF3883)
MMKAPPSTNIPTLVEHREVCERIGEALWQALGHPREGTKQALAIAYYFMPDARQFNIYEIGEAVRREKGGKFDEKRNVITDLLNAGFVVDPPEHFELRGHQVFVLTLTPAGRREVEARGVSLPNWVLHEQDVTTEEVAVPDVEIVRRDRELASLAQGFGLSPPERHAVETHAMALARAHLEKLRWDVDDVRSTRSYDFECTRGSEELIVEVKGTISTGKQIFITRNEVDIQRARHPNNALIVVHSINLTRSSADPKADGGELLMYCPWTIEEDRLRPLTFQYAVRPDELA